MHRVGTRARGVARLNLRTERVVQEDPDQEAEAGAPKERAAGDQVALPRTNSTKVPIGMPVGPLGSVTRSDSE